MPPGLTFNILGHDVSGSAALDQFHSKAAKTSEGVKESFRGIGKTLVEGIGIAGIGEIGAKSIEAADQLEGANIKIEHVFGDSSDSVKEWASSLAGSFGISEASAESAAGAFANILKPMGESPAIAAKMSEHLTTLSADMARFNNADPASVQAALISGLRGRGTALRQYGVDLSSTAVNEEAARLGLVKQGVALSDAAKAQAAYAIILHDTKDQQGAVADSSHTLKQEQQVLSAEFTNFEAGLGTALLPMLTSVAGFLVDDVVPALQATVSWVKQNEEWLKPLAIAVGALWAAWKAHSVATDAMTAVTTKLGVLRSQLGITSSAATSSAATTAAASTDQAAAVAGSAVEQESALADVEAAQTAQARRAAAAAAAVAGSVGDQSTAVDAAATDQTASLAGVCDALTGQGRHAERAAAAVAGSVDDQATAVAAAVTDQTASLAGLGEAFAGQSAAADRAATSVAASLGGQSAAVEGAATDQAGSMAGVRRSFAGVAGAAERDAGRVARAQAGQATAVEAASTQQEESLTTLQGVQADTAASADTMATEIGGAELAGGDASSAAFGPIGLAIAAVGTGAYIAAKHFGLFGGSAKDQIKPTDDFTSAIQRDNDALGANTKALVEHKLQSDGAYDAARTLGIQQNVLTQAMLGNKTAVTELKSEMDAAAVTTLLAIKGNTSNTAAENTQANAAGKLTDSIGNVTSTLRVNLRAAQNLTAANKPLSAALGTSGHSADTTRGKFGQLHTSSGNLYTSLANLGSTVTVDVNTSDAQSKLEELLAAIPSGTYHFNVEADYLNHLHSMEAGQVGHNAQGTGFWRGGPTVVGELGAEVLDLPPGSRVSPTSIAMSQFGGGKGDTHVYQISLPNAVLTQHDADRMIASALERAIGHGATIRGVNA